MSKLLNNYEVVGTFPNGVQATNILDTAPPAIGHYCHVVTLPNGIIQLSGQKAWDPKSGDLINENVRDQTKLVMENISAILKGLGLNFSYLTRLSCYLSDPDDYPAFNDTYASCLGDNMPSRTVLAGLSLRGGALVEIVADAYSTPESHSLR
jgi:2-iminobutanoate/2-iminopropanoate deaminase